VFGLSSENFKNIQRLPNTANPNYTPNKCKNQIQTTIVFLLIYGQINQHLKFENGDF